MMRTGRFAAIALASVFLALGEAGCGGAGAAGAGAAGDGAAGDGSRGDAVADGAPVIADGAPVIADGTWELVVDRALAPTAGPVFPTEPLREDDYTPVEPGRRHVVHVAGDGATVRIAADCGAAEGVAGAIADGVPGTIHYALGEGTFAGGRFLVWIDDAGGRQAELTIYGSGVPIVSSERGGLRSLACP